MKKKNFRTFPITALDNVNDLKKKCNRDIVWCTVLPID